MTTAKALLAGGCFWDLQSAFKNKSGIISTRIGYTGGRVPNPTFMEIYGGKTGHVEAVEITFNNQMISYKQILEIFFANHDPTNHNSEGKLLASQHRSAIFYFDDTQKQIAKEKITELQTQNQYTFPIITEIKKATMFYPASPYHQTPQPGIHRPQLLS